MGFVEQTKQRVIEWLGAVPADELKKVAGRAYEAGFYDGGNDDPATAVFKAGGQGYKRISDNYLREGLIDYRLALKTAWELWQKSPLAKRLLVLKRDHIIGHGSVPTTDNKKAAEIIKAFYKDNKLDKRSSTFTIQLFGMGEQCYPAFVKKSNGRVRLGYIDPGNIHAVIKHRDNSLEDWAVCVERIGNNGVVEKYVYRIIRQDENYVDEETAVQSKYNGRLVTWEQATLEPWEADMLKEYGKSEYAGSCFFTKVNSLSNQPRGMSDLLQVADWIDQAEEVIFALADRERMANYFVWLIKLIGATPEQVTERANKVRSAPPRAGSMYFHNDSEEPSLVSPDLGQTGTVNTFRTLLGFILGGMGFPVHAYGFGDDANRATAVAQNDPMSKTLEHDQGIVKEMFLNMCQFAIDQAAIAGKLDIAEDEEYELTLNLPEVTAKDMTSLAASLNTIAQAMATAQQQGWSTEITAVTVWAKLLAELDIDIDPAEELKKAMAEKEEREREEEEKRNNALKQRMAAGGQNGSNGANGNGTAVDLMSVTRGEQ